MSTIDEKSKIARHALIDLVRAIKEERGMVVGEIEVEMVDSSYCGESGLVRETHVGTIRLKTSKEYLV